MHHSTFLCRTVFAILAMVMFSMTVWADVPNAPVNLTAHANSDHGFDGASLQWEPGEPTADSVGGYEIYISSDDGATWQVLGAIGGNHRHSYRTGRLPNGTYSFQVSAVNADGNSDRSNTATVSFDYLGVRFTSRMFVDTVSSGVPLVKDFDALASNDGAIVYSIAGATAGMAIDAGTGVFTWTPPAAGRYLVEIRAAMASDSNIRASATYHIVVDHEPVDLCASLSGTVSFPDGSAVASGWASVTVLSHGETLTLGAPITHGAFSVAVPAGTMILHVSGETFRSEHYNNTYSPELAERLSLVCNDSRVLDITVDANDEGANAWLAGAFVDTAGHRLGGRVIAYRIDSTETPVQVQEIWARGGYYRFDHLPAGEYVIWGRSSDSMHVPGYHVAGGVATHSWTHATRVVLAQNDSSYSAGLLLVYVEGGGRARLRGTVVNEGGRIRKQDDPRILGATPVDGATVYALDGSNNVGGYAITDAEGRFEISELKQGDYTVLVDRVGLRPLYQPVTIADDTETVIDLQISSTSSVAGGADAVTRLGIYPNPVDASARIRFDAAVGTTELRLIDLRGTEVLAMSIATTEGENSVILETASLPAGLYLLRIGSGRGATSAMITIAR